ncbi:DP-EP family protein [Shewanella sp. JM162201]|uniref:DP-EP family protein n=1 Tax=Shewanella jiangmenensis TaxID=2837387 RepID=A0ABS5V2C9_9GAMM|nr:DP-EP family protein [Shewanella jiangmenensis]MBT1444080.1 DP-EP family protein [Shewanella jiangmenensis]
MPTIIDITVTVSLDDNQVPQFAYNPPGSVTVIENSQINYKLDDQTNKGLSFAGAAFATPFDRIIDAVEVTPTLLTLTDTDAVIGTTGFRLLFNIAGSTLQLCSHDPQVINKDEK